MYSVYFRLVVLPQYMHHVATEVICEDVETELI